MRSDGFTLIEVLVVVAIATILTTLVVLRIGDWQSPDDPQAQLERLAALIERQCEQAMFQSRPRGVRITAEGYDFWQATSQGWVALTGEGLDRPRQWLTERAPELLVEGHGVELSAEPEGPQLSCQPMGELTLFELLLRDSSAPTQPYRLVGNSSGRLVVTSPVQRP